MFYCITYIPTSTASLSLIIIDSHLFYKISHDKMSIYFIFSISTLPFTAHVMRKLRYFEYLFYDHFIVIPIHSKEVNKIKEYQFINFT